MIAFQVVHPIALTVKADSFKEAVKNFIKVRYAMNLQNIILHDHNRYVQATFNYYKQQNKKKVGIDMFPAAPTLISSLGLPLLSGGVVAAPLVSPLVGTVKTGNVILPTGPIQGPGYDVGPAVASVHSPIVMGLGATKVKKVQANPFVTDGKIAVGSAMPGVVSPGILSPVSPVAPIGMKTVSIVSGGVPKALPVMMGINNLTGYM